MAGLNTMEGMFPSFPPAHGMGNLLDSSSSENMTGESQQVENDTDMISWKHRRLLAQSRLIMALALEPLEDLIPKRHGLSTPIALKRAEDVAQASADTCAPWLPVSPLGKSRDGQPPTSTLLPDIAANNLKKQIPEEHSDQVIPFQANLVSPLPVTQKVTPEPGFRNDYFEVVESAIAGWGARAVRELKKGDVILREMPILTADVEELFQEFQKLDHGAKKVALSLHANALLKPGTPLIHAVWATNCFAIGRNRSGLFPIAARFNHACPPAHNVDYKYDRELGVLSLTVRTDDIDIGEELTITYGVDLTPTMLYWCYGFSCKCGACPGLSDKERGKFDAVW